MREVREATGCRSGDRVNVAEVGGRISAAIDHLNRNRLRPSRGWKTSMDLDEEGPSAEDLVDRACFWNAVYTAVQKAVRGLKKGRARRMAERSATLQVMADYKLIKWTRGGKPCSTS